MIDGYGCGQERNTAGKEVRQLNTEMILVDSIQSPPLDPLLS